MKTMCRLVLATVLAGGGGAVAAAQAQHQHAAAPPCATTDLTCATVATPAFAENGSLWLTWAAGGRVMAAHSPDLGRSFAPALAITKTPVRIDNGPDARPKIAIGHDGHIIVTYAVFQDERYNGRAYVSRSVDGGATFATPQPITNDTTSQRFETAAIDPSGDLFVTWLDKRDAAAARAASKSYPGAALAFSWGDGGDALAPAQIAEDQTCECCRLAVAFAGPHRPVVAFRNIFNGTTRDHAIVTFADATTPGPLYRVSADEWKTNVCPHQGPALAVADGIYHVAWFTNGKARQGLFYARSQDGGAHFSTPMPVGVGRRAERPTLFAQGQQVWLAWKEFDGEATRVALMRSADGGATWDKSEAVAATDGASDHPLLIGNGGQVFLSWKTSAEGYRLLSLPATP
jgi:hypothetical protein